MKRDFDSSIKHARSRYLPAVEDSSDVRNNKTDSIIEGVLDTIKRGVTGAGDLAGSIKSGLGKVANATQKINSFAQNQKHGGTFSALSTAGAFDPKGDSQQVRAEWGKMDQAARAAWQQKGQTFVPKMNGKDYFYNYKMQQRAKDKTDAVGKPAATRSSSETPKTPAQQEQAAREAFRNNPAINQQATNAGMDEDAYVAFTKAQQQ